MAKLPRKTQKIFCSKPTLENQTSVFGTMKTADKQYSTDVGILQSNAAYEQGWKSATIASYKPFMEDFNTLNYINTSQLAYLFQQGIPEWDESTTYYKNSFCSYNGDLWQSLIDDNLGNAPFEGDEWTLFTSGKKSGSGLEICDIGMALYVDETKGLRRYLNGQIVDINTNTQAFLNRLKDITTLYPSLLCTEEEWQTAKTMSAFGQVGKFVFNYSGDKIVSVRLPRVVNVQGLFDLQNLGMTVEAGLPNASFNIPTTPISHVLGNGGSTPVTGYHAAKYSLNDANSYITGNSLFGKSNTVQQEAIQYPYFIQVATGSETENNIVNDIELNNPYVLFKSEYFEAPPYNLSWLKSDGEYKPKATYIKAYEALVVENNSSIAVGTTVDLPSGTKYTKRGLSVKLSTASDITDYDFVLNTAEETFRLPIKTKLASGKAVVGNGMVLGLTDGTNNYGLSNSQPASGSNLTAFAGDYGKTLPSSRTDDSSPSYNSNMGITTDPTKSGLELADSGLYLYYYVGETVQNANLIDAGRIGEQLANKVDLDLTNANPSQAFKNKSISWGMPDYSAGVYIGQPTTYQTIPVDSLVRWSGDMAGGIGSLGIRVANTDESIEIDFKVTTSYWCQMATPIPAGWKVKVVDGREGITYYPMKGTTNA